MYRVLLPLDSSERRARAQARVVTGLPCAADAVAVTLVHVYQHERAARAGSVTQLSSGSLVRETLVDAGVTVEEDCRHGDPASEILSAAEAVDADLVVMGGRKRSSLGRFLFGSVSQSVLLRADRPVTVAGASE